MAFKYPSTGSSFMKSKLRRGLPLEFGICMFHYRTPSPRNTSRCSLTQAPPRARCRPIGKVPMKFLQKRGVKDVVGVNPIVFLRAIALLIHQILEAITPTTRVEDGMHSVSERALYIQWRRGGGGSLTVGPVVGGSWKGFSRDTSNVGRCGMTQAVPDERILGSPDGGS